MLLKLTATIGEALKVLIEYMGDFYTNLHLWLIYDVNGKKMTQFVYWIIDERRRERNMIYEANT